MLLQRHTGRGWGGVYYRDIQGGGGRVMLLQRHTGRG